MWAKQIDSALCLINGKTVTDDGELLSGPVSWAFVVGLYVEFKLLSCQFNSMLVYVCIFIMNSSDVLVIK